MSHISNIPGILLTAVMALAVLSVHNTLQPAQLVQAAAATPTPASTNCDTTRTIQVSGSATVNVVPDRALIHLGVVSSGASVDEVEAANSTAILKVMQVLQTQGIAVKDISTDIYVVEPVYENYDSLYIKGYRIHNQIEITLRDIRKASAVVSAALKAGANQVNGVEFFSSELRKYRDQARDLAVKAAHEKAQALASAAGQQAGCVVTLSENTWSYYNGWGMYQNAGAYTQNVTQNVAPSGGYGSSMADEPISLGQISIKAEISATYSLQ